MQWRFATISKDHRLTVTVLRHQLGWLPREGGPWTSVVEIKRAGKLYVTLLDTWAQSRGMKLEDARKVIDELPEILESDGVASIECGVIKRKGGAGNALYRLELSDVAVWSLFEQGQGPMVGSHVRQSARLLVASDEQGMHILSQQAFDMLSRGGLPE